MGGGGHALRVPRQCEACAAKGRTRATGTGPGGRASGGREPSGSRAKKTSLRSRARWQAAGPAHGVPAGDPIRPQCIYGEQSIDHSATCGNPNGKATLRRARGTPGGPGPRLCAPRLCRLAQALTTCAARTTNQLHLWGSSSAGRASPSQGGGRGFKSLLLHQAFQGHGESHAPFCCGPMRVQSRPEIPRGSPCRKRPGAPELPGRAARMERGSPCGAKSVLFGFSGAPSRHPLPQRIAK